MKIRPLDLDLSEFLIGHMDSFRIGIGIEFGFNLQSRLGSRACDQIDDHFMTDQGLAPPY